MHWIADVDPYADCCVHGGIYLRIGSRVVSDGKDLDWSISTAAFNFLRSLFHNHRLLGEEPLVPHCGFTMWIVEGQPDGLYMPNCDTKINWEIRREGKKIIHEFPGGAIVEISYEAWCEAVCKFADEIYAFFLTA